MREKSTDRDSSAIGREEKRDSSVGNEYGGEKIEMAKTVAGGFQGVRLQSALTKNTSAQKSDGRYISQRINGASSKQKHSQSFRKLNPHT